MSFSTATLMKKHHIQYHNSELAFLCEACQERFKYPKHLLNHQISIHLTVFAKKGRFSATDNCIYCKKCNFRAKTTEGFFTHLHVCDQGHSDDRAGTSTGQKQKKTAQENISNTSLNTESDVYDCPERYCQKYYSTEYNLKRHLKDFHRVDTSPPPQLPTRCPLLNCERTYTRNMYALKIHYLKHLKCEDRKKSLKPDLTDKEMEVVEYGKTFNNHEVGVNEMENLMQEEKSGGPSPKCNEDAESDDDVLSSLNFTSERDSHDSEENFEPYSSLESEDDSSTLMQHHSTPKPKTGNIIESFDNNVGEKSLENLESSHSSMKLYKCTATNCEQWFTNNDQLINHSATLHKIHQNSAATDGNENGSRSVRCLEDKCDRTFANYSSLNQHMKLVHKIETSLKCPECNKTFASSAGLKRHLTTSHMKKNTCWYLGCDIDCQNFNELVKHTKIHLQAGEPTKFRLDMNKDEIYALYKNRSKCFDCNESFPIFLFWKKHMEIHKKNDLNPDQLKAYQDFLEKANRIFDCPQSECKKSFSEFLDMKFHVATDHRDLRVAALETWFKCPENDCDKVFDRERNLNLHWAHSHINLNLACPEFHCTLTFKAMCTLKLHFRAHRKQTELKFKHDADETVMKGLGLVTSDYEINDYPTEFQGETSKTMKTSNEKNAVEEINELRSKMVDLDSETPEKEDQAETLNEAEYLPLSDGASIDTVLNSDSMDDSCSVGTIESANTILSSSSSVVQSLISKLAKNSSLTLKRTSNRRQSTSKLAPIISSPSKLTENVESAKSSESSSAQILDDIVISERLRKRKVSTEYFTDQDLTHHRFNKIPRKFSADSKPTVKKDSLKKNLSETSLRAKSNEFDREISTRSERTRKPTEYPEYFTQKDGEYSKDQPVIAKPRKFSVDSTKILSNRSGLYRNLSLPANFVFGKKSDEFNGISRPKKKNAAKKHVFERYDYKKKSDNKKKTKAAASQNSRRVCSVKKSFFLLF